VKTIEHAGGLKEKIGVSRHIIQVDGKKLLQHHRMEWIRNVFKWHHRLAAWLLRKDLAPIQLAPLQDAFDLVPAVVKKHTVVQLTGGAWWEAPPTIEREIKKGASLIIDGGD
jgi:hypothetical protein